MEKNPRRAARRAHGAPEIDKILEMTSMTATEFCELAGVSSVTVSRWRCGVQRPPAVVRLLATALTMLDRAHAVDVLRSAGDLLSRDASK